MPVSDQVSKKKFVIKKKQDSAPGTGTAPSAPAPASEAKKPVETTHAGSPSGSPGSGGISERKKVVFKKRPESAAEPNQQETVTPDAPADPASSAAGAGRKKVVFKKRSEPAAEPKQQEAVASDAPAVSVSSGGGVARKKLVFKKKSPGGSGKTAIASETKTPPDPEPEPSKDESFKFFCVYCGQKLSGPRSAVGRKITCPSCNHKIEIPDLEPVA